MLKLTDGTISEKTQQHLDGRQALVDAQPTHAAKAEKADKLWEAKDRVKTGGKAAFSEIKEKLDAMCTPSGICSYCEMNEATDIEHIAPKGHFPKAAFLWDNYLLACKNCNSGYKLDNMWVFQPKGTGMLHKLEREAEPPSDDLAFINPRSEDPMQFLELNLLTWEFEPNPRSTSNPIRDYTKAEKTLEILGFGERRQLKRDRAYAFDSFRRTLRIYLEVLEAADIPSLKKATSNIPPIQETESLEDAKARILESLKASILNDTHPTVFREMIRQRHSSPAITPELRNLIEKSQAHTW